MPGFAVDPVAVSDEDDLATFQINLIGSHFVTKYALPLLFAQPDPEAFERTVRCTPSHLLPAYMPPTRAHASCVY